MSQKRYLYHEIMEVLGVPCPPEDFHPRATVAFRWVFDRMDDEQNFLPQYYKGPGRFEVKPPIIKCQAIGLSFFSNEQDARERYEILTARMLEEVKRKLGTMLAKGDIREEDGVSDLPDKKGHFTHHPFEGIDLANRFDFAGNL